MKAIRIGGRLRRLRQERRLTGVQMANELGISPSYLALLESNSRPVTVRVLLKLAERFRVDLAGLAPEEDERLVSGLLEAFADPLFDGADVKTTDVRDLVSGLPAVARAVLDLYRAHRERAGPVPPGSKDDAEGGGPGLPSEEVGEFIQARANHFPSLEAAAEALWAEHGLASPSLAGDLAALLARRLGVEVEIVPQDAMPGEVRRYDPLRRRLRLSEMLPPSSRAFQLAHQVGLLTVGPELDALVSRGKFTSLEADALARGALANYFAAAVMMPYARLLEAARATRYDLDVLGARFGASFEQVAHRLTSLRRPGAEGVPFHLLRVDIAGNISKRYSASGIPIARFGAACPRWNVYDAFATPGMLRVQVSRMPDGATFFCVARTVAPPHRAAARGGLPQRVGLHALGLGCAVAHARDLAYADGLNLEDPSLVTPIGVSCRVCPRADCTDRAVAAAGLRLSLDENRRGMSTYAGPGAEGRS